MADRVAVDEELVRIALLPASVHQATGVVAVQLDLSLELAFAMLSAEADNRGIALVELARRVVSREYRFAAA